MLFLPPNFVGVNNIDREEKYASQQLNIFQWIMEKFSTEQGERKRIEVECLLYYQTVGYYLFIECVEMIRFFSSRTNNLIDLKYF